MSSSLPRPRRAPIRVAVLGTGAMGRLHARVFAQLSEDFELVGVYDPDVGAGREVGLAFAVQSFSREADAIAASDLVVVASPIDAHAGSARRALARGRHALVEKPLCATAAQALALAHSVGRGQRLFVGHSERFNPVVRALRELVRPQDVRSIRLRRTSPATRAPTGSHGALVSLGVHDLDLVAYLTDSPVALRDVTHLDDDRGELVLTAARGAVAWVHVDRRAESRERSVEVVTKDAVFSGDLLAKTLTVRSRGSCAPSGCVLVEEEPLVAQAVAVARALEGSAFDAASGMDGARALLLARDATTLWQGRRAGGRPRLSSLFLPATPPADETRAPEPS